MQHSIASASGSDGRVLGRSGETEFVTHILDSVQATGSALIVDGEAGIGKTTILSFATDEAKSRRFRILKTTGIQNSSSMGYEALHELLHPVIGYIESLPDRQRAALMTAFALVEGPVPDRLVVSLAALGLLEEAAAHRPVFIAVEDVQWLDRSSAAVVGFLGLRIDQARIMLLVTERTSAESDSDFAPTIPRLTLEPLEKEAASALLDDVAADLPQSSRARILREAAGNPLALRELPAAFRARHVDHSIRGSRLPITRRMEKAYLDQLAGIPERSRRLLLLAAAAEDVFMPDLMAAAKSVGLGLSDLAPLESSDLVSVSGNRLEFRHALLRSAVQGAASTEEWINVQQALAGAVSEPARATWHRAAATFERDEGVAEELETVAIRARQRGAQAEAAAALRRAAVLTPAVADKARRLAFAAETARAAGMSAEAVEMLEEVEPIATEPRIIVQIVMTRLILSLTAGTPGRSKEDLDALSRRLTNPEDEDRRVYVLWGAAVNARGRNLPQGDWRRIEGELESIPTSNPLKSIALALLAPLGRVAQLRAELPSLVPRMVDHPLGMLTLAIAAESLQDMETALTCWGLSAERLHEMGSPADECQAVRGRANMLLMRGRFSDGLSDAEYAHRMAVDTGQPLIASLAAATASRAHSLRGNEASAQEALARSLELAKAASLALVSADARWAAGLIAMGQHRYRDALIEFTYMTVHPTRALWAIADRTEAAVRANRAESVRDNVLEAETAAAAYRSSDLMMLVERSKALLSEGAEAAASFERSIRAGLMSESPFELARTRLLYGEWLRRDRQVVAAREQLAQALSVFDSTGAESFASRAAAELRAAGEAPARRIVPGVAEPLTPQELQIARLAGAGMSNKDIADRVYLSHRTVSTHLYKVFPKLGIANRAHLREALVAFGYEV